MQDGSFAYYGESEDTESIQVDGCDTVWLHFRDGACTNGKNEQWGLNSCDSCFFRNSSEYRKTLANGMTTGLGGGAKHDYCGITIISKCVPAHSRIHSRTHAHASTWIG